jgi:hypothetical protein
MVVQRVEEPGRPEEPWDAPFRSGPIADPDGMPLTPVPAAALAGAVGGVAARPFAAAAGGVLGRPSAEAAVGVVWCPSAEVVRVGVPLDFACEAAAPCCCP